MKAHAVVLSIRPSHLDMFFDNKEYIFYRNHKFYRKFEKIYIYGTKPIYKLVGEIRVGRVSYDNKDRLWEITKEKSIIAKEDFDEFFANKNKAYAIKVINTIKYDKLKDLSEIDPKIKPPRRFCYAKF